MKRQEVLRGALMFANAAVFGAMLLSAGLGVENPDLGFWCFIAAVGVGTLLSFVPLFVSLPPPRENVAPIRSAVLLGAGLCAPLGVGALYFKHQIAWAGVELQALFLLVMIGGLLAFILMLAVMDRIRKAGEKRDLRARGELP